MVNIGQASIDENGKARNGKAGNQTGRELNIKSYYKSSWHTVLRCKDPIKAEIMALSCERACKNMHIGYDQNQRNTLRTQAKAVNWDLSKITVDCECDCSSLMTVCAESTGIPFTYTNAPTTSTMKNAFVKTGFFDALTDSKYLTSDKYLKRGDILIKNGHTVMVLGDGSNSNANINRPTKSIDEVAKEVLDGLWSNGTTRKLRLEQAGYNYSEVQAKVNELLKKK